jgi:ribose-phosphate pyrophosphokinase
MLSAKSVTGWEIPVKVWKFPCGEVGVKIETGFTHGEVEITLLWEGNDDLLALGQLVDALRHNDVQHIALNIPYFPYSRQDRRCNQGEGHALKMVATYINSLNFSSVYTMDAHSYVLEAVVNNLVVTEQAECAWSLPSFDIFVAPDAGASKKIFKLTSNRPESKVLVADKKRDYTGKIVDTTVHGGEEITGKTVCVVDDLCDGGATFIELAKVLKKHKPKTMALYVTHGFFTKGAEVLTPFYDTIYVSNLMSNAAEPHVKEI